MLSFIDFYDFLQVAVIYKRLFGHLILHIDIEATSPNRIATRKCPLVFGMLIISGVFVFFFAQDTWYDFGLPRRPECIAMHIKFCTHYSAILFIVLYSGYNYRELHFIWCKFHELTHFAADELKHQINFRVFRKRLLGIYGGMLPGLVFHIVFGFFDFGTPFGTRIRLTVVLFKAAVFYVSLHVIFVIRLFNYLIEFLVNYVALDYRKRVCDFTVNRTQSSLHHQLKLFKLFHYKLWEIANAISRHFGPPVLILTYHALVEIAYSAYHIFWYLVRDEHHIFFLRKSNAKYIFQIMQYE